MENLSSNQAPKLLTRDEATMSVLPPRIVDIKVFASCCFVPIITNSVLSSFSFK